MRRRMFAGLLILVALALALTSCSSGEKVDWELKVSGAVSKPLTVSYDDLAGRTQTTLDDVLMDRSEGEDTSSTWEGVALSELLNEAGVSDAASAVIFRAADGYEREVDLADVGDAIVALKENGESLLGDEKLGPIRIVIPGLPASRWVGQLVEIEVVE
ncbi:MAG: molybdopterin-dependent oxidoreductase [Anaerolineae bacterium]